MCALGHRLEELGFATVALAGVRAQAEKTRPPRALWTAGVLGRPLGEPDDVGFQMRVLRMALGLLERTDGPVILEDFPEDPPGLVDTVGWAGPVVAGGGFASELEGMLPLWRMARARFGRTSVGLARQGPEAWPGFVAEVLAGGLPVVAGIETTALAVRFLCDDVKAFYGEAAQAVGAKPSAGQVDAWFWGYTEAGRVLRSLRLAAMESGNNALRTVGGRFFVPAPWVG